MRYRLRTLLILLAVLPPVIAGIWFLANSWLGLIVLVLVVYVIAGFWLAPGPKEPPQDQDFTNI
jgi:hypothetical protein